MNWVHLHLALNHIPVLGALFGALLLAVGLVRRSDELQRVSLWALALLAAVTIPIKFTGDFASEALAPKDGIPARVTFEEKMLNAHEQAADQATTGVFLLCTLGSEVSVMSFYAMVGDRLRVRLKDPATIRLVDRVTGVLWLMLGLLMAWQVWQSLEGQH